MSKYQNGKIYTIRNVSDQSLIYVGSTTQRLSRRMSNHRDNCKNGLRCSLYSYIRDNDWSHWYIELYEMYSCNSKEELEKREGQIIREIATINKRIEGRTKKEYYHDNIDKIKEYKKEYREQNVDKINEYKRKYYEENTDKIREYNKHYRDENAEKKKESDKKWREANKEKIRKHKTEKICCDICGASISRHGKAVHQRTKACMFIKSLSNTDTPNDTHNEDL